MDADTLIVMPAYNEAGHLSSVITAIKDASPDADMVVVDDGSSDDTAGEARKAGAAVLRLRLNMGYGVALQTGYKYAQRYGYEYLVQIDADGQHDPAGIRILLERVKSGRCDVCIGSRFLEGDTYRIPWARRFGMILFRRVASLLVGSTITDPTSGFQAMNRRVIEFFTRDSYPVDYPDTDVIVMLHHHGFRVTEAPVIMYPAATGRSIHSGLRPIYYLFKMALNIPLNVLRREK